MGFRPFVSYNAVVLVFLMSVWNPLAHADSASFSRRIFEVNPAVNPCNDFYSYACGRAIEGFKLPKTRSRHNFAFHDLGEFILQYKKNYFANLSTSKPTSTREQQIQHFYKACMNEAAEVKGEQELVTATLSELSQIKTREQFADFLFANFKSGGPGFLSLWANLPNFKNSERMDAYFEIPLLTASEKNDYKKDDLLKDLKSLHRVFFESIGADRAEERAEWVSRFESGLAASSLSSEELNKNVFSVTEFSNSLQSRLPHLKVRQFIKTLPAHTHIRNIAGDKAFEYVEQTLATQSLDQLKSIYLYNALRGHLDDAYPVYKTALTQFSAKHLGKPAERPDRAERCTSEVQEKFPMEIDSILMPRLFPNFPKEKVSSLVEKIRTGLLQSIKSNSWLSKTARRAAQLKLKALNIRLVAPETDQEWGFHKEGDYDPNTPVQNRLLYTRLIFEKDRENLSQTFKSPVWGFGPLEINASLLPAYNAIIFPVAILQPPFYDPTLPEEVNLGAIGAVIGHELGHTIDDKGYTFDHKGRVHPWFTKEDSRRFQQRTAPLIKLFDRAHQNGAYSLGENIGDLVGLTNAYEIAFPKSTSKPTQLKKDFFLQYARLWCEVQTPENAERRFKMDVHALGIARTNEQVKLQPGFAEAFSCKPTDPLVTPPSERFHIW